MIIKIKGLDIKSKKTVQKVKKIDFLCYVKYRLPMLVLKDNKQRIYEMETPIVEG